MDFLSLHVQTPNEPRVHYVPRKPLAVNNAPSQIVIDNLDVLEARTFVQAENDTWQEVATENAFAPKVLALPIVQPSDVAAYNRSLAATVVTVASSALCGATMSAGVGMLSSHRKIGSLLVAASSAALSVVLRHALRKSAHDVPGLIDGQNKGENVRL